MIEVLLGKEVKIFKQDLYTTLKDECAIEGGYHNICMVTMTIAFGANDPLVHRHILKAVFIAGVLCLATIIWHWVLKKC